MGFFNLNGARGGSMCMTAGGVAEGTNSATIQLAVAIDFAIDGVISEKAITDNLAITAATEQAVSTKCCYLAYINAAGTVATLKGSEIAVSANADDFVFWPECPDGFAAFGGFTIVTDATHTYTAGTTDNSATGITDVYFDMMQVPVEPLSA